jgi:hypothetical protein
MKRNVFLMLLALALAIPAYSQDKKADTKGKEAPKEVAKEEKKAETRQLYTEITVEDFEATPFSDKDGSMRISRDQKFAVAIRDQYPAPVKSSKKYLGVMLFGRTGDVLTITPHKKLIIDKYCRTISLWVYGKSFTGELSILLRDADGTAHRLSFGKLNFLEWKKLTVRLTDAVAQESKFLNQKRQIEILQILYNPGTTAQISEWSSFYIDDITAEVREKFVDKQPDDWYK